MEEVTELMMYNLAFRVRLYIGSRLSQENRVNDLSDREALLLELIDTKGSMSISELSHLCPKVSNSTISTTISKLWKDKNLVEKNVLPENQRVTTVNLTDEGRKVLAQVKKNQARVCYTVAKSLGLAAERNESFRQIFENSIRFFDELLGLQLSN